MNLITQFMFDTDDFNELPFQTKALLIAFYIVPAAIIALALIISLSKGMI